MDVILPRRRLDLGTLPLIVAVRNLTWPSMRRGV